MKWSSLLKGFKDKVGLTGETGESSSALASVSPNRIDFGAVVQAVTVFSGGDSGPDSSSSPLLSPPYSREKDVSELDFKRYWEEFRSSGSEKDKEVALNRTVDIFCSLVKKQNDVVDLVNILVETHIFSFVIGRAFVTDIEKLRIHNTEKSLHIGKVMDFFSELTKDGINPGSNFLYAVEVLVSGSNDKQSFLDSGILCCLIYILNAFLNRNNSDKGRSPNSANLRENISSEKDKNTIKVKCLEVEGRVVHIMKALSTHPSAALSLIEDDSLQLLFQMVTTGSSTVFSRFKHGHVPLHTIQLYRHAMQILNLLLVNDNGSTAKYIRKHQLIKVLLVALKDFNPDDGDSVYTMSIVDLLMECVELSYKPGAGSIRLKEDIHNAHGYQFLVQFALILSNLHKKHVLPLFDPKTTSKENSGFDEQPETEYTDNSDTSPQNISPALSRLLDVLVNLAQTGPDPAYDKPTGHNRSRKSSIEKLSEENWENVNAKIRDLDAIQMLQDIFLKSPDKAELQSEVLNRLFKIFTGHLDNYKLCQKIRTVTLFILNMAHFPSSSHEIILKILEYAVTVLNCVPEQELFTLCCLLEQSKASNLKLSILSLFVKLLSFDRQYSKVLHEVGLLELLIAELKRCKFIFDVDGRGNTSTGLVNKPLGSLKNLTDNKDAILSSPRSMGHDFGSCSIFEDECTVKIAWICLDSILKKTEANQSSFRSANGFTIVLPFLISDIHRSGVLRILSSLIIEDRKQAHQGELEALIECLKSGMVQSQYRLLNNAKCDIFGALWRILVGNSSAQRVFGESTGFSLLFTTLHSFKREGDYEDVQPSLQIQMNIFSFLLRVMTAAVCNNAFNRSKLHATIASPTFYDLLRESNFLSVDWEKQVIQLLLELALEIAIPPSSASQAENYMSSDVPEYFLSNVSFDTFKPDDYRVYNSSIIGVLIRSLLLFTPKVQLDLLIFLQKVASAHSFNRESLTSTGCVGLLLDIINPFLTGSSSLLVHALQIIQILGSYRLSTSELRVLMKYILKMKSVNSGHYFFDMMEIIIQNQDTKSDNSSLSPFVEMDMSKIGHASVQVSLGERTWPPSGGYSFICWFQYKNFFKDSVKDQEKISKADYVTSSSNGTHSGRRMFRIFSVGNVDDGNACYAELYLQDNGVLTLATSNSSRLSFSGLEMEEGKWHHLAVIHSKPNALAGLFQASVAYIYIDGKLKHTGKLGYSLSPVRKSLQVTIGTPVIHAEVDDLSWKLRSCYLFEEVLTPGSIFFMYILGRGYRGIFQDADLLQFIPIQACGGSSMAILDSLDGEPLMVSNRNDSGYKQGKLEHSGIVWDDERLYNLSLQLKGKKLIFAFDGTQSDTFRTSGTLSMLNLVDPLSPAASSIGGIARFGHLNGDSYICHPCIIGESIRAVGGITVILSFVEASETRDMLHMSLALLACALHQSPQNVSEMKACRGYHLLAIFLHRRMPMFDMQSLDIFFHIAACEASFLEPPKLHGYHAVSSSPVRESEPIFQELSDDISSMGSHGDMDDFFIQKDSSNSFPELEGTEMLSNVSTNCIVLSNAEMVEYVLLDWTLWVTAPVSIQLALLEFLERMVSIHRYRNHNLTLLRQINLVRHLLVTLQRGDVEVPVVDKLVVLLGVILEDGFLASELEEVVKFVIMTFDPPELRSHRQIIRETMRKRVIVRNLLLDMLIDLQVTINLDELIEQWHKIVSSKLIIPFIDEAVHPTSMRRIMTLLGVSLTSNSTFALKFRGSESYQSLTRVLPSFYDSPDIYYIIFCLIFGKAVYPRLPEVRMADFHTLMSNDGTYGELMFPELLDPVIAMAKYTFDRLSLQAMHAQQNENLSSSNIRLVAELAEAISDVGDLQAEALKHKTSARLMGGEAGAPSAATSVLRFMVDLAKMHPGFSSISRRMEFLENCVDLYFSCARAYCALKMVKYLTSLEDNNDSQSMEHSKFNMLQAQDMSSKNSLSMTSIPEGLTILSSEEMPCLQIPIVDDNDKGNEELSVTETDIAFKDDDQTIQKFDCENNEQMSNTHNAIFHDSSVRPQASQPIDIPSSTNLAVPDSPHLSDKSSLIVRRGTSSSPVAALTSWFSSSGSNYETKIQPVGTSSMRSTLSEIDVSTELGSDSQGISSSNTLFPINPDLLAEIDDLGYGGGPCSAAATTVLDFIAVIIADMISDQIKACQHIERILEAVPLYLDIETVLVFQGLCLSRLMNFLERRLLRDDEEEEKKLDKSRWSVNLDSLCWMITDRVYMGAFPEPIGVLRTLEFLFSMLQFANKNGYIEEAVHSGKSLFAMGSRQLDSYINALLKNANRVIMYCFLPSFLTAIHGSKFPIDICTILQLIIGNKRLVFCPSNNDNDLICCLCVNLIFLLRDQREVARNSALDIIKHMLMHRRAVLEDFFVLKSNLVISLDILNGGFDKLLTGCSTDFFEWFHSSESNISRVLEQCASIMWENYINNSLKFPGVRIKGLEGGWKREMGKKSRDALKLDLKYWDQIDVRRYFIEITRDAMSTELRVIRQDKYGWVLHAESEWQIHLQRLVHERGIFPIQNSTSEPGWQLCPIEGPYRMRKKLERCKLKVDRIQNALVSGLDNIENDENASVTSGLDSKPSFNFLPESLKQDSFNGDGYKDSKFKDADEFQGEDSISQNFSIEDRDSSVNYASFQPATEFEAKSSICSIQLTDNMNEKSDLDSLTPTPSIKNDEMRILEDKSENELLDNGEFLIRPYLEPTEKIHSRYNCERVVGLDKHDGIFLIGNLCLYVIENFYVDDSGCICEKLNEDELSIIDQALGVSKDSTSTDFQSKSSSTWRETAKERVGGRAWAYNGGAWEKEKVCNSGNLLHPWHMWKVNSVHEFLKRDYQLRPVAIEIFSMDGCNDLLVFHKNEREKVFKNIASMNFPRNTMLDPTISGLSKQDGNEGSGLFKVVAKSFSKRWQNGEISNFQYLMHLNTLAGRGYRDLTQYPVFPWVLADYESDTLDLTDPKTFRKLDKPMGCQTEEGEDEFRKRYESWDDPDVPKFHYGSHYSSAGIVLFYLLRLPPFSTENQKLQGGQFDHADRLFNNVRDTWLSASSKGNTSDVKELIPEFFYMPEFFENCYDLDLGEKQSGEKVGDVVLPSWAKGSAREFIKKHREALECEYVSENLHHWIDLIFGFKQRGVEAEEAINVFYHYTYEGSVNIDSVSDPAMKASILAQINHFGQTPKQLFFKPHVKRQSDRKIHPHPLRHCSHLVPHDFRKSSSSISQIVSFHEKILIAGANSILKPGMYRKYVAWGFPDRSLRFLSYDQGKILSIHESLHGGNQIECAGMSHDGQILVTGAEDGVVAVWRIVKIPSRGQAKLSLECSLSAHTSKITCVYVSQPYTLIVTGSDDCTVILWDMRGLAFVKQLPQFTAPVSAIHVNDLTGEIVTAAGILLAVWSVNGNCLAFVNTSQLPSDLITSVTSVMYTDWQDTNWYVTGHQSGALKVWNMIHFFTDDSLSSVGRSSAYGENGFDLSGKTPEYRLVLRRVLKSHKHPVTALHLTSDYKQLLSGDSAGHLLSWTLTDESLKASTSSKVDRM